MPVRDKKSGKAERPEDDIQKKVFYHLYDAFLAIQYGIHTTHFCSGEMRFVNLNEILHFFRFRHTDT